MADEIRVNGNLVSWQSYILTINGERYTGLREIDYGHKLEGREGKPGMSRSGLPVGRPAGKYSCDPLKIKVFTHTAKAIRKDLAAASLDGSLASVEPPIVLQYFERGGDNQQGIVEFFRCAYVTSHATVAEDSEAKETEIEFQPFFLVEDGIPLFRPDNAV